MTDEELKEMKANAMKTGGEIFVRVAGEVAGNIFTRWLNSRNEANKPATGAIIEDPPELKALVQIFIFQPDNTEATVFWDDFPLVKVGGFEYLVA
jgi:hypothetical protein